MIRDLSETLEQLLTNELGVQVEFERPSDAYNPAQGLITLNLFLYDIRENVELRNNQPAIRRQNNQTTIVRPPLRVACSYLVTAWPNGNTDLAIREHRLLSQALAAFAGYPTIPAQFLQGSLVGQKPPLPMVAASADGLQNPAEFWTALGNHLKPSLKVVVTIAMNVFDSQQVPSVITAQSAMVTLPREDTFRIAGTVTDTNAVAVVGANIVLVETGRQTTSGSDGEYSLRAGPAGNVTLRVTNGPATQDFNVTVPAPQGTDYDLQLS